VFKIDDDFHAELQEGEFASFDDAMAEVRRRAELPWNEAPNVAPCTGWRGCGRRYEIVEYDGSSSPWREIARTAVVEVSAAGVRWL